MAMKKLISTAIALVIALVASVGTTAQTPLWDATRSGSEAAIQVQAGLNVSQFLHIPRWNKSKAGVNVGVMVEKPIFNSLSAKVGLFYTMKGGIGKNDAGFGGILTTTLNPGYLELPVMASYRYALNSDIRLQFDFGPYFAIGLHGKDVKKNSGNGSFSKPTETEYELFGGDDPQMKRFDFGFRLGPQLVWKERFSVALAYEVSAMNVSNMGGKIGNSNFMINIGYTLCSF